MAEQTSSAALDVVTTLDFHRHRHQVHQEFLHHLLNEMAHIPYEGNQVVMFY